MTASKAVKLTVTKDNPVVFSEFDTDDKYFAKDYWMVIAVDSINRLVAQGSINIR
jgi:hypothetical protein